MESQTPQAEKDPRSRTDIEYHDEVARTYDRDVADVYRIYAQLVLHPFLESVRAPDASQRVLDLGCGTGSVTVDLAARGFDVTAVDHSAQMLGIAREKVAARRFESRVRLELGDMNALRFRDAEFDGVTCQGVLHHLSSLQPALGELTRVLRPGGFFFVSEPCTSSTPVGVTWLVLAGAAVATKQRIVGRSGKPRSSPMPEEAPVSASELLETLAQIGLPGEVEYLTHLPLLERFLPDRARREVIRFLSSPWRRTRGDIIFVHGRKPLPP